MLWITRVGVDGELSAQAFQNKGYDAVHAPAFTIETLPISQSQKTMILNLDEYTGLIFVSKTAVELGINAIDQYWPQIPDRQRWCVMGAGSAMLVQNYGVCPIVALPPNSEGLLQQDILQRVEGQKWLIIRGEGGRELLREKLEARGAKVDYLELYRRASYLRSTEVTELLQNKLNGIVTASTQVLLLLKQQGFLDSRIINLPIVVPGARAALLAMEIGFKQVIEAKSAQDEDIIRAWTQFLGDGNE